MNHYAVENLFGIEGLNIAWYGIIITFGMILGFMLALRRCKKTGVEPDHVYNLVLWLIPVCILCARAYYVLIEWEQYKDMCITSITGGLPLWAIKAQFSTRPNWASRNMPFFSVYFCLTDAPRGFLFSLSFHKCQSSIEHFWHWITMTRHKTYYYERFMSYS